MDWTDSPDSAARARLRRASLAASACLGIVVAAALGTLLLLRPVAGSMSLQDRAQWVLSHPAAWRVGWALWMLSAVSLFLLCTSLGATLTGDARPVRIAAVLTVALAATADLAGLWTFAGVLPGRYARLPSNDVFASAEAWQGVRFAEEIASLLSGGLAGGLYTIAGLILAWAAWFTSGFPRTMVVAAAPSAVWGLALTVTAIRGRPIAFATTALLVCFVPWLCALAIVLRRRAARSVDTPAGPG